MRINILPLLMLTDSWIWKLISCANKMLVSVTVSNFIQSGNCWVEFGHFDLSLGYDFCIYVFLVGFYFMFEDKLQIILKDLFEFLPNHLSLHISMPVLICVFYATTTFSTNVKAIAVFKLLFQMCHIYRHIRINLYG